MTEIDLVTGFLGAGKTTFIKKYGDYLRRKNIKFAVVENEFGAPGVDSALLEREFGNVAEISGGCICCTLKTSFHQILLELCRTCDRIIVEPSGIFDGDVFFEVINSPDLKDKCKAGMGITLVDPHTVSRLNSEERLVLASELADMGCVLWTKTDIEPACDLDEAKACIQHIAGEIGVDEDIPCYPVSSPMLKDEDFEKLMKAVPIRRKHERRTADHTMIFQSTRIYPEGVYTVESIDRCILHMTSSEEYGEISRIKGFVKSQDGAIAVNCTVSDRLFEICSSGQAMLNVIGRRLNRRKISECLKSYATGC